MVFCRRAFPSRRKFLRNRMFMSLIGFHQRTLLRHRKDSSRYDEERNSQSPHPIRPIEAFESPRSQIPNYVLPQITYNTGAKTSSQIDLHPTPESINQLDKILSDWTALRTRARLPSIYGVSRIPARLYTNDSEKFGAPSFRARTRSLL